MPYCCAVDCNNGEGSGRSFFRFPKDKKRRRVWIERVKRKGFAPTDTTVLCSDHFERSAYLRDPKIVQSTGVKFQARLKPDAVPTIFAYLGETKEKRRSLVEKRRRMQAVLDASGADEQLEASESESEHDPSDLEEPSTSSPVEERHVSTAVQATVTTASKILQTSKHLFPGPKKFSRGVQFPPKTKKRSAVAATRDAEVQCDPLISLCTRGTQYEEQECDPESDEEDDSSDPDFDMTLEDLEEEGDEMAADDDHSDPRGTDLLDGAGEQEEKKFIVYESCLRLLLLKCFTCLAQCRVTLQRVFGTLIVIEQICQNGHRYSWTSQPFFGQMPAGNLMLASAVFFSGSSAVRVLNMLRHLLIPAITQNTYHLMQRYYLVPATRRVWNKEQETLLDERRGHELTLGGDARCCSPGHTAKFGSYTLMDMKESKVLDVQLVQSNEVRSSNAMELEGLKRGLRHLKEKSVRIRAVITDRHASVKKFFREEQPDIQHWFDVWHVAKGIKKKILAKGKRKDCQILNDWAMSVSNHVYWCAATSNGEEELVRAKWLSVLRHVADQHEGHHELFPRCEHGDLDDRNWIKKGSKPHKELGIIVENKMLVKDIGKLSPAEQTSSLEAFHKVIIFFAPKSVHYQFTAMEARLMLASMHYNENSQRAHAVTKKGKLQWSVSHPKARQGDAVLKAVKVPLSFNYVERLMSETRRLRDQYPSYSKARVLLDERSVPAPVASKYPKPVKEELVKGFRSRFNTTSSLPSSSYQKK